MNRYCERLECFLCLRVSISPLFLSFKTQCGALARWSTEITPSIFKESEKWVWNQTWQKAVWNGWARPRCAKGLMVCWERGLCISALLDLLGSCRTEHSSEWQERWDKIHCVAWTQSRTRLKSLRHIARNPLRWSVCGAVHPREICSKRYLLFFTEIQSRKITAQNWDNFWITR